MAQKPMILREVFEYEFSRLDPSGSHIDPPSVAIYETLMVKGPDWGPHPMLSDSWKVQADGYQWKVRLYPGLKFHSGARCDATAIVTAFDYLRWNITGGQELWYWDPVEEIKPDGHDTVVFTLRFPYIRLPSLLWGFHTAVYNEALRADATNDFGHAVADGTGPFRLESWSPTRIIAERWPEYRGLQVPFITNKGAPKIDGIEWISISSSRDRVKALEKGDVHCIHAPSFIDVERLKKDTRFTVVEYSQQSNVYFALNWKRSDLGFNDLATRHAISLGIDRADLVEQSLAGHGNPTYGPIPPGDEFYDPRMDSNKACNISEAAEILNNEGWKIGRGGVRERNGKKLSFECLCQDDEVLRTIANRVKDQLSKLGIRINLRFVKPFKDFYDACGKGPDSFISKWLWQDPMDAIIGFTSTRGQPFPNWQYASIPELDAGYRKWLEAETKEDLKKTAFDVQRIAAEKLPYIPLLTPNDIWVFTKKLRGFRPFSANLYPFYHDVTIEE